MIDAVPPSPANWIDDPSPRGAERPLVLVLFGTRPEVIKLAPVVHELSRRNTVTPLVVSSGQHRQLLKQFQDQFNIPVKFDLDVMVTDQGPNGVCSAVISKLDPVIREVSPAMIVVQGDTSTTLAGALTGFHLGVPVAHVEAGLRSGNPMNPFPEEMNRRLVSKLATLHFAATSANQKTLLDEGVPDQNTYLTGNPVVDSLQRFSVDSRPSDRVSAVLAKANTGRMILLTTHRRESFGIAMKENLRILGSFVEDHDDVSLVFPVHPNPNVRDAVNRILRSGDRIHLIDPVDYVDFVALMKAAWLIVSDSGDVQEEAPSLGKPLLVLRENTERREAIDSGVAKLVGGDPENLRKLLELSYADGDWVDSVKEIPNPFGDGNAAPKIVDAIEFYLAAGSR